MAYHDICVAGGAGGGAGDQHRPCQAPYCTGGGGGRAGVGVGDGWWCHFPACSSIQVVWKEGPGSLCWCCTWVTPPSRSTGVMLVGRAGVEAHSPVTVRVATGGEGQASSGWSSRTRSQLSCPCRPPHAPACPRSMTRWMPSWRAWARRSRSSPAVAAQVAQHTTHRAPLLTPGV